MTPLSDALHALDGVLALAVDTQARLLGPASLLDPWRGMHLDRRDVERLLRNDANAFLAERDSATTAQLLAATTREWPPASILAAELGFTPSDLAILLIALAPDVDLRYERIYGYLQDDIARRRPTNDLLANLLACDADERIAIFSRLAADAPLRRAGLLVATGASESSELAVGWKVDSLWRKWLLGTTDIDGDVDAAARMVSPRIARDAEPPLDADTRALLKAALERARSGAAPLRLLLQGPHGSGKLALAQTLAGALGLEMLVLDVGDCSQPSSARALIERAHSASALFGAMLYVHGLARLEAREPRLLREALDSLAPAACHLVLSCATQPTLVQAHALPVLRVELRFPDAAQRLAIWTRESARHRLGVAASDVERLAKTFALTGVQIRQAAAEAAERATVLSAQRVGYADLAAAARTQCGGELARLTKRITPRADFSSLVVPDEVRAQLGEICARVATRDLVCGEWGDGSPHARTQGITALFAGPSGTGKTLAAEALAHELGLDLYRIDLACVVSKYIGETEKNLDRVFAAAEHSNAVLLFDEADALFGKRSEVKDAHDRYANIEIAYLLQKMDQFDGLAILATNLRQNLDDAFARRLTFSLAFPFPEEPERRKLWERLWLPGAPRAADVDLAWFAREFRMSGGNIRNSVLAAAHLAAADGQVIAKTHLLHATRREFQKFGKTLTVAPADARSEP